MAGKRVLDAGGLKFFQAFRHHAPAAQLLPIQEILDLLSALPITPAIYPPTSSTPAPSIQPSSASWPGSASMQRGSTISGFRRTGLPAQSGATSSIHTEFPAHHLEGMDRSVESRQDDERAIGARVHHRRPLPLSAPRTCPRTHAHRLRMPSADPQSHAVRCGQAPPAKHRLRRLPSTPSRPSS